MPPRTKRRRKPRPRRTALPESLLLLRKAIAQVIKAQELESRMAPANLPDLTEREGEVLKAVLDDGEETLEVVAEDLHIHPRTLRNHIHTLCTKMRVRTLRGLIKAAVKAGWG